MRDDGDELQEREVGERQLIDEIINEDCFITQNNSPVISLFFFINLFNQGLSLIFLVEIPFKMITGL